MNLEARAANVIRPALEKSNLKWHGRQAFRRGLAMNLHRLGVSDKVIQQIPVSEKEYQRASARRSEVIGTPQPEHS
jgi:hypothetical protein